MSDPFLEQVKALCLLQPSANKWVLVPHSALRWTLGERLLLEGHNWVNLRWRTPYSLALESCAPEMLALGRNPCSDSLGPSLIESLLESREGYFQPSLGLPGTAEALWRCLSQLRMAGLDASDLQRLPESPKRAELTWLLQTYQEFLVQEGLADRADLFSFPNRQLPIGPEDFVLIYPYHRWSFLEQEWLQNLPGQVLSAQMESSGSGSEHHFFWASRRSEEIDIILQQILQHGLKADQVEIAAHPSDQPLLLERLANLGLSATFETGLPALATRPGQALARILQWMESDFSGYHLRELLESKLLRGRPNSYRAARFLEDAQIQRGRFSYFHQLAQLRPQLPSAQLSELEAFQEWLQELFQRFPWQEGDDPLVSCPRWISGLQATLKADFQILDGNEAATVQALLRNLEELKRLPQDRLKLSRFLATLSQRLQRWKVLASRPRPGCLHICRPQNLGISGRGQLFWIGLEEGQWSGPSLPDCVLDDEERQQVSSRLPLAKDQREEFLQHVWERIKTASGQITFSYARYPSDGDQEQMPAWLLLEIVRLKNGPEINYRQLDEWVKPGRALSHYPSVGAEVLHQLYPWLARGEQAQIARAGGEVSEFDGWVPQAAGVWDPRRSDQPISVSSLHSLATCPFRTFLERGLGLRPPSLEPPDPDEAWLDAARRGELLHDIYAAYHRRLRQKSWRPQAERDRDLLQDLLREQLAKLSVSLPAPSKIAERATKLELWRELEHFLKLECQALDSTPIGLEVPFGLGSEPEEPLATPEAVRLEVSESLSFRLRGRIDRIDRCSGGYQVIDYKTGRRLYTGRNPRYDRGRLLQHALYALVAEELLRQQGMPGRVVRSSYYFPTRAAESPWVHFSTPPEGEGTPLEDVLQWVLEPFESGLFIHSHQPQQDCRFCHYQRACESSLSDSLQEKLQSPLLEGRRRLLETP